MLFDAFLFYFSLFISPPLISYFADAAVYFLITFAFVSLLYFAFIFFSRAVLPATLCFPVSPFIDADYLRCRLCCHDAIRHFRAMPLFCVVLSPCHLLRHAAADAAAFILFLITFSAAE